MRWLLRIKACLWVIRSPAKFLRSQNIAASALGLITASDENTAQLVHEAFWMSFLLVVASGVAGGVAGGIAGVVFGAVTPRFISALQVAGALLLLWGTLFVRGWEIQTYKGATLIELVNQWIYRSLYCVGTAVLVASLVWPSS